MRPPRFFAGFGFAVALIERDSLLLFPPFAPAGFRSSAPFSWPAQFLVVLDPSEGEKSWVLLLPLFLLSMICGGAGSKAEFGLGGVETGTSTMCGIFSVFSNLRFEDADKVEVSFVGNTGKKPTRRDLEAVIDYLQLIMKRTPEVEPSRLRDLETEPD